MNANELTIDRVLRSRAEDRGAFEDLVCAHARLVWAAVYGLVRDPSWTEDLVQETFLRAWESVGNLRDPASFPAWILSIARRLAWRSAALARREVAVPEVPERPAPGAPPDPEEAREQVHAALARLPERYRIPVTLHLLNGMDYGAIQGLMGLENGSLRGLIARGTKRLRAELAPWWRNKDGYS